MKDKKLLIKTTKELLKKMGFKSSDIKLEKQSNSSILVLKIQTEDADQLIGQGGSNLRDLQRILKMMIGKQNPDAPAFILDINNYREKRKEFLKDLAQELAEQVIKTKKTVILQPMSSYERRIVHLELSKNHKVITESIGEGPERRVIIKLYS